MRVAALIMLDGRVVLVRHRAGESRYHLLPGGGVDWGETLSEALVREVEEETGLRVEVDQPVLISDTIAPDGSRHVVNIVFSARVVGGRITDIPSDERVEAVELVESSQLAELDLRPPFADALNEVITEGGRAHARYLGALFTGGR